MIAGSDNDGRDCVVDVLQGEMRWASGIIYRGLWKKGVLVKMASGALLLASLSLSLSLFLLLNAHCASRVFAAWNCGLLMQRTTSSSIVV
jgi:hypothetical protein